MNKQVTKLDLSDSDVSNASLSVISELCPLLRIIDLNAAKMNRMAVSSQGFYFKYSKFEIF